MYNPRWPHTFKVLVESLDANGLPITDSNGNPVYGIPVLDNQGNPVIVDGNPKMRDMEITRIVYDSSWNPRRNPDGTFVTEDVTQVPWGYRTSTGGMKTSGEVWVADYKISTPMLLTDIPSGTVLLMTDYIRTFRVKVVKMTTYNWGTNLWVDNIKN